MYLVVYWHYQFKVGYFCGALEWMNDSIDTHGSDVIIRLLFVYLIKCREWSVSGDLPSNIRRQLDAIPNKKIFVNCRVSQNRILRQTQFNFLTIN